MDSDISYFKFKIIFINIFSILLKAATLNLCKLETELKELKSYQSQNSSDDLPEFLVFLISLLLMAKFFFGYLGLAANVIAIFPILTDEQPDLLLPTILSQAIENILLSAIEILLGYITWRNYLSGNVSVLIIFMVRMVFKITLSLSTLNIYSDLYSQLKFPKLHATMSLETDPHLPLAEAKEAASEQFVQKTSLALQN